MAGVSLIAVDPYDGAIFIKTAARHAELIVKAARHDKRVWDILEKLTQSSDLFALMSFEAFFIYALLAHHNPDMPKNEPLLAQFGYHEQQILADLQGQMNGNGPATTV
jgi:hypothetical protein